jgi:hypothetical protein
MRILDKGNLTLDLTKLGFEPNALQDFMKAISELMVWCWSRVRPEAVRPQPLFGAQFYQHG